MPKETILVVDDEKEIADLVALYLQNEGFRVCKAYDAAGALDFAANEPLDLAVLDVMLPGLDGFQLCQKIRETHPFPIIMLTAKGEGMDKITGLSLGADDYMTKPFSARELLLRISAILKRCSTLASEEAEVLRSGGLVLDLTARRVEVDGRQINLTPREFDLLTVLMSHPDVAFSRKRLLDII